MIPRERIAPAGIPGEGATRGYRSDGNRAR